MIRTRNFVWTTTYSPAVGSSEGWRPEDAPQFDAGGSLVTTHDTIEHLTNRTDWKSEVIASGVSIFTRGLSEPDDMPDTTARDLYNFWGRDHAFEIPEAPQHWKDWVWPSHAEMYWHKVEYIMKGLHEMIGSMIESGRFDPKEAKKYVPMEVMLKRLENLKAWVKVGFRLAMRVYGVKGPYAGNLMSKSQKASGVFVKIMDALQENYDKDVPDDNSRLTITYDTKTFEFKLKRHEGPNHKAEKHVVDPASELLSIIFGGAVPGRRSGHKFA